jgi:hypothetical protein
VYDCSPTLARGVCAPWATVLFSRRVELREVQTYLATNLAKSRLSSRLDTRLVVVCQPLDPVGNQLAAIDCSINSDSGGPVSASYALYRNAGSPQSAFNSAIAQEDSSPAPESTSHAENGTSKAPPIRQPDLSRADTSIRSPKWCGRTTPT